MIEGEGEKYDASRKGSGLGQDQGEQKGARAGQEENERERSGGVGEEE